MSKRKKIIVILGPTASGKTSLAVKLAHVFGGEIVSADSRQVYRGMDVGTGKDLGDFSFKDRKGKRVRINYHLIDVVGPKTEYNIVKWNKKAKQAIQDILDRNKLPIVVGGTGLYIQSLVDNYNFSSAKPKTKERQALEKKEIDELLNILKNLKEGILSELDENDKGNKRRLIRYIEILREDKNFPVNLTRKRSSEYDFLVLGLNPSREDLDIKIRKRLVQRVEDEGMIDEVKDLHQSGVSWNRLQGFGLEYRFVSDYLRGQIDYKEMIEKLFRAIRQFSKRQMTWFRRWERQGRQIAWVRNIKEAKSQIKNFLKN